MKARKFLWLLPMLAVVGYVACRKTDSLTKEEPSPQVKESRFFSEHKSSNPQVQGIVKYLERQNEKLGFVEKTVKKIGYPRWDKALISSGNARRGASDTINVVYIPFVRDSQNYVNASLVIRTTPSDTTTRYLCDWQYKDFDFDSTSSGWNARNVFHVFTKMDNLVFGTKSFRITDSNLLRNEEMQVLNNSGISFVNANVVYTLKPQEQQNSRPEFWLLTTWCDDYDVCISEQVYTKKTLVVPSCPSGTYLVLSVCTDSWVYIPSGDGGTGGGGNGSGGTPSSGGGGSGGGGLIPGDCGGVTPQALIETADPCTPGWEPIDPEDPGGDTGIEITLNDILNFKNLSEVVKDMELQAGINTANFFEKVFLDNNTYTIPTPTSFKIYVKKQQSLIEALLGYSHELSNAINIATIRALIDNAVNNPKNPTNRTIFANSMAQVEAKGVYSSIIVAIETLNTSALTCPNYVYNAVVDHLNGTITLAEAINIITDWIISGDALDENGHSIYQGYLYLYNNL